jgi:sugar phosphate isomerase/epimerase
VELTCTSFSFPLLSFERALQAIALLEIPRYDIGAHEGASHIQPSQVEADPQRVAQRIHHAAGAAGLQASDFFATFGHGFRDRPVNAPERAVRDANLTRFRAIVACARTIGARGITLLPGVVWDDLGPERSFDLSVEALRELLAVASDGGLRLSVEAHLESVAESPELARRLCDQVPGLKLTLDYSHFVAGGHSPDEVHGLVRYAGHFHARQAGPGQLQAGSKDGTLDFDDIVGRLAAANYDGDLCVEYTWQEWRDCWHQDVVSESIVLRDQLRRAISDQPSRPRSGRGLTADR